MATLDQDPTRKTRALGKTPSVEVSKDVHLSAEANIRVIRARTLEAHLPKPTDVHARFAYEGVIGRLKKLFRHPIEVGSAEFDRRVYIATTTPDATRALLREPRAQAAVLALTGPSRHLEIDTHIVRAIDEDAAPDDDDDVTAELLVLAACLMAKAGDVEA